jgi:hypothetical protein
MFVGKAAAGCTRAAGALLFAGTNTPDTNL